MSLREQEANNSINWQLAREVISTKDSEVRAFQFKLLNNVLHLNKILFKFGKSGSRPYSFCNLKDETLYHLF